MRVITFESTYNTDRRISLCVKHQAQRPHGMEKVYQGLHAGECVICEGHQIVADAGTGWKISEVKGENK